MLRRNNFVFLTYLVFSFPLMADCQKLKTEYTLDQKTKEQHELVCISKRDQNYLGSSKNCEEIQNASCPFHIVKKDKNLSKFITDLGSPPFNLCHHLKGSPQLYKVELNGKWESFERCFWNNSKEFVDLENLWKYYESR